MENGKRTSATKAKVVESPRSQEAEGKEANGGGALVPVNGAAAKVEIMVRMKRTLLHCPLCTLPFTPPIFQCGVGHLACGPCHGQLPGKECRSCDGDGGAYTRCFAMDAVVSSAVVPCPHQALGCRREVAYHHLADHRRACPHAPCACPEPGCAFAASPGTLAAHLAAPPHAWPVHKLRYGEVLRLRVPESEPRRLLVAEGEKEDEDGDGRAFVLAVGEHGGGVAVTVACVGAAAGTRYMCKMWANGGVAPVTGKVQRVLMETEVPSCSSGGGAAAADEEKAMFLGVPRKMVHGESKQIHLGVRISKVSSG
ncbi:hypothetical protein PR202_ga23653 [Eleusine coracana subsp. coracana]|uniref:RING-type E3 ubiquitin transferase n=1 Tax=Eleusine coracana subsp. coracana TaxID=191504 RepID=A0AAV5D5S9_ELECO|nr:hypothetical protein PR202_ga23653 [Eleusine coracana subsp. coracana]